MLKLTGFPLPDVGLLTIAAMVNKSNLAKVTLDDLDEVADRLQEFYLSQIGKNVVYFVFTTNSGFTQPSYSETQRSLWADLVLRGYRDVDWDLMRREIIKPVDYSIILDGLEDAPRCVFSGEPAYLRVSREMFPMINGRSMMNFSPMGEAGMPVSAIILLAIHAMPLGCVVSQGGLLAVESSDPEFMMSIVKENLAQNERFIDLAKQEDYDKYPNLSYYKSRLIDVLVTSVRKNDAWADPRSFYTPSLSAYHFVNGKTSNVKIHTLPSSIVDFVRTASAGDYEAVWNKLVSRSYTQDKPRDVELQDKAPRLTQRSLIYEDLFDLPENARHFLRTYFLRHPLKRLKNDPRQNYNLQTDADLISWDLTALFLERIMNMSANRIDQIRALGDRLAAHILENDDKRLLKDLYAARHYNVFRLTLLRTISRGYTGDEPLVTFDGYVEIFSPFEEGQGFERVDWNLARDLLLIRIYEQLHLNGYWAQVTEVLKTIDEEETAETANA